MDRPVLKRTWTVHDIHQTREDTEDLTVATETLTKIRKQVSSPRPRRKKKSAKLLSTLEESLPTVRSADYQSELTEIAEIMRNKNHYKSETERIEKIVNSGAMVPTLLEVINDTYASNSLTKFVKYISSRPANDWSYNSAKSIIYEDFKLRPDSHVISYLVSKKLLKIEAKETILRQDNLLSKLISVWMPAIVYRPTTSSKRVKIVRRMLKESFKHLASVDISFHRTLQRQIREAGLQVGETPIVFINCFLRFYIPEFRAQSKDRTKGVRTLIQGYINGVRPLTVKKDDFTILLLDQKLTALKNKALELFKN